jgi:hypothetical protein
MRQRTHLKRLYFGARRCYEIRYSAIGALLICA